MIHKFLTIYLCLLVISSCKKNDPVQYELTTSVLPIDGGSVSPSSGLYKDGESVVLTAIPSSEFLFVGWSDGVTVTVNPLTVVMNSSKKITASFEKRKYALSLTIEGDGTVKEEIVQTKSVTNYSSGTLVKLTAVSNKGSEFVGWAGDYSGADSTFTITVDKPKSLTVTFKKIIYPTAILSGNDSILIGDAIKIKVQFSGTPPFSFDYSDGAKIFSVSNISDTLYIIPLSPKQSTIYKILSVRDKVRSGIVSGSSNIYVQPHFVSRTENYKGINLTVGNIQNNLTFRGSYYHIDELLSTYRLELKDQNLMSTWYNMSDHSYVFFDYNNDGYLDLFGWMVNSTPAFGRYPGKYILINNVLGGSKKKISYYDSDISNSSGMEVNDFNNDGVPDALFYYINSHTDGGGLNLNPDKPQKVLLFSKEGTFKEINATAPLIVHDIASGDVDNDGDVDLIMWAGGPISKPYLYQNDGNANFTEAPESFLNGLSTILATYRDGFPALATELFDINNDGFLDIIIGYEVGGRDNDVEFMNAYALKLSLPRIYWGDGSGKFDLINNYTDLPNKSIEQWSFTQPAINELVNFYNTQNKMVLGFNFVDFDHDGDFDILTAITPTYTGYILQLYENLGNKSFKDVTLEKIDHFNGLHRGPLDQFGIHSGLDGDFPNFYEIRPYDVDGDGDLDLVPHGVACWNAFTYSKNFYWANVGGKFVRNN